MKRLMGIFCLLATTMWAMDITVEAPDGDVYFVDVEEQEALTSILTDIEEKLDFPVDTQNVVVRGGGVQASRGSQKQLRKYETPVTKEEKKDISYIINNLAYKSYWTLLKNKSSMDKAGDRIAHIHPLRFLLCIFTDVNLKEGLKTIYKNGNPIWGQFVGPLKENLKNEYHRNNLRDDQLADFAATVKVDKKKLDAKVHNHTFGEFVVYLVKNVP